MRRIEVFFYGLFMDETLLRGKGLSPSGRARARVENFRLVVGRRATLAPCEGAEAHGLVYSLTHAELDALYSEASVGAYRPEAVRALLDDGTSVPALCFNLPAPPAPGEQDPLYASKLRSLAARVGLPPAYVASIR